MNIANQAMAFLALICAATTSFAADYCVRAGATGAGNGSDWTNAYPTLPATLQRGAIYYVADGSYGGYYSFDDAPVGTTPITIRKATVSAHGTSTGWQASYGDGQAVFGGIIGFFSSYWVFDGQVGGGPGSWKSGYGFKIDVSGGASGPGIRVDSGITNVIAKHFEVQGNGGGDDGSGGQANDGVTLYPNANNCTISHAYIHDMGRCPLFCAGDNAVFEYIYTGWFEGTGAVHSEIMSAWRGFGTPGISNLTVRHSIFGHIESTGGIMVSGNGVKIYGNVFYRLPSETDTHPHGFVGKWTQKPLHNVEVYNNVFINPNPISTVFGYFHQNADGPSSNIKIKNNIIYRAPNFHSSNWGAVTEHDYNHFVDSAGGTWGEVHGTSAVGDPFVSWQQDDFRLLAATQPGTVLSAPFAVDATGAVRGADGVWDRGALELAASSGVSVGSGTGLAATYYDNRDFTGKVAQRIDPTVDFAWGSGAPIAGISFNTFSVRWKGQVQAQRSETYTFFVTGDDGVRLWVSGQLLVNQWKDQGAKEYSGSIVLTAGQKYDLVLEYYDNLGAAVAKLGWSSPSMAKQIIPASQLYPAAQAPVGLPAGWVARDVGSVGLAGTTTYANGTFTISGSGDDIWNSADAFQFASQALTGDGSIVARVASVQNTDGWAKAGVMIREGTAAGAKHAFCCVTSGNGVSFQRRTTTNGGSSHTSGSMSAAPRWVKLVRQGPTLTGYESADGVSWTVVGTETISLANPVQIGLAVTSNNNSVRCTAMFDHVLVQVGGSG